MHRHDRVIGAVLQHQRTTPGRNRRRWRRPASSTGGAPLQFSGNSARQGVERRRRNIRQLAAEIEQLIDRQIADAASVGDDGQPVAMEWLHASQSLGGVERRVDVRHAQQAGATESGVVDVVGRGEIAGMGAGAARGFVAAGADHDHRLDARSRARGGHEALGVFQMLDIEQDRAGHRISA